MDLDDATLLLTTFAQKPRPCEWVYWTDLPTL